MGNSAKRTDKETATQAKVPRKEKNIRICWNKKTKTAYQTDNTTGRNEAKDIGERRKT